MPSIALLSFLFLVNFVASIVLGVLAFGDAVVFHLLWQVTQQAVGGSIIGDEDAALFQFHKSDVQIVTILSSVRAFIVSVALGLLAREGFQRDLFLMVAVAESCTVVIGVELLSVLDPTVLKPTFMIVLFITAAAFAAYSLRRLHSAAVSSPLSKSALEGEGFGSGGGSNAAADSTPFRLTFGVCAGAVGSAMVAGVGAGLLGVGAPPVMAFILYYRLPPQVVRGTYPAAHAVVSVIRTGYAWARGQYHSELWEYYVIVVIGAVVGVFVGNRFGRTITQTKFYIYIVILMFMAGVSMSEVTVPRLILAAAVCGGYVLYSLHLRRVVERRTAPMFIVAE